MNKILRSLSKTFLNHNKVIQKTSYLNFHEEFSSPDKKLKVNNESRVAPNAIANKYQIYKDDDSTVIFDIEEERLKVNSQELDITGLNPYDGLNLERGVNGVFEIEDLVQILRRDNAGDIFVCSVPKQIKYVDYMCIVTGLSYRHMNALAQFVRKVYKMKKHKTDLLPKIEGENSREWMALDLGNIALHIFSGESRKLYDLESLWSIGPEFDKEYNKPEEPLIEMYNRHAIYLSDLTPKTSTK